MVTRDNQAKMVIRRATADDQATIRQMIWDIGLDPSALHWSHFVVAELGGKIVSIGQIRPYRNCPELGSIATLPDQRGKGYAAQIIRRLLADWDQAGTVYLECREHMMPYYREFGFEKIPWWQAPMPLKFKAGMGALLGGLFRVRIAVMKIERPRH